MSSREPTIAAGEFKARCLALLDRVAATGEALVVTKRGRPVARVVPARAPNPPSLRGSVDGSRRPGSPGSRPVGRGPVIVLDTHAWIWWASEPARLGRRGRAAIEISDQIGIPAVCCFEVAAAAARGRIGLDRAPLDWIEQALALPRVRLLPLSPAVSVKATQLGTFHGDPADRLIVATAIIESATLVTRDRNIRGYASVDSVW